MSPVLVGLTQRQLRAAVLYNCNAIYEGTASATGTTSTIVDNNLPLGTTDDHKGKHVWHTSTVNANQVQRVTASSVTANVTTLTFLPVVTGAAPVATDTYQLIGTRNWQPHPAVINGFINAAIREVTGQAFDPEESLALHGDGRQKRFDVPSELKIINRIFTRQSVESVRLHDANTTWDTVDTDVTQAADSKDSRYGGASLRLTVAAGLSAGDLMAYEAISSTDISGMTHLEFWAKSSVATAAGDIVVELDNTAAVASPVETLSVPALVANTWTFCRVALANPHLDTAIISVGIDNVVDLGAHVFWVNDIKAVRDDSAVWVPMDSANWRAEEEARDLVFQFAPSYRLIKLVGGDNPLIFTADTDVNEVDDQYVIARATELAMLSGGAGQDPDQQRSLASYWGKRAAEAKRALPWITGRAVS